VMKDNNLRIVSHVLKTFGIIVLAAWRMYSLPDSIVGLGLLMLVGAWYLLDLAWHRWYKQQKGVINVS
jgi:hypothetical protein